MYVSCPASQHTNLPAFFSSSFYPTLFLLCMQPSELPFATYDNNNEKKLLQQLQQLPFE